MRAKAIEAVAVISLLFAVLFWAVDRGRPQTRRVVVRIDAVWSVYAVPGKLVEIVWVRNPKSPRPYYERIVEKVRVRTHEGFGSVDDHEPTDRITIEVTAEQAERLKQIAKIGWLRALPIPEGD